MADSDNRELWTLTSCFTIAHTLPDNRLAAALKYFQSLPKPPSEIIRSGDAVGLVWATKPHHDHLIWGCVQDGLYLALRKRGFNVRRIVKQKSLQLAGKVLQDNGPGVYEVLDLYRWCGGLPNATAGDPPFSTQLLIATLARLITESAGPKAPRPLDVLRAAQEDDGDLFEGWTSRQVSLRLGRFGLHTYRSHGAARYRYGIRAALAKLPFANRLPASK